MNLNVKINDRFGKLIVIGDTFTGKNGHRSVGCKCSCGNIIVVRVYYLVIGKQTSCGCVSRKETSKRFRKGTLANDGYKVCSACVTTKPVSEFTKSKSTKDGLDGKCKSCKKNQDLLYHYGITLHDYNKLLEQQGGVCAVCGGENSDVNRKYFSVDHDHSTGQIRGLLCNSCNRGIGQFQESVELLEKATSYLQNHTTQILD